MRVLGNSNGGTLYDNNFGFCYKEYVACLDYE